MPMILYVQRLVIKPYSKHWREIGIKLQLQIWALDNIQANCANDPRGIERCCAEMINEWLRVDVDATWLKLLNAIDTATTNAG